MMGLLTHRDNETFVSSFCFRIPSTNEQSSTFGQVLGAEAQSLCNEESTSGQSVGKIVLSSFRYAEIALCAKSANRCFQRVVCL